MENNKQIILQVFGCLMKDPLLLSDINNYHFDPSDFNSSFEKQIFGAIYNIYVGGATRINPVDIDVYLQTHEALYPTFLKNNGLEFLQDAEALSEESNFNYYYTTMKKYNAIRDLKREGFDISSIYPEDNLADNAEDLLQKFDRYRLEDIFDIIRENFTRIESKYGAGTNTTQISAIDGISSLLEQLKESPEIGASCQGTYFNTAVRGARRGKYYLRSAGTGVGKTRSMVGDACHIAYPIRYHTTHHAWEVEGNCQKILYISTEQEVEEIQTLILAYLTGINEEKILYGRYSQEEYEIIQQALSVMENYKDNFIIAQLPDPNVALVKGLIRKNCILYDTEYVFYDYIFSSPNLLSEFKDFHIREDVILCLLSTALKDLAVELNVFLMSSTQLSGDIDQKKGIKDQTCLRGAKSIADKVDVGCIITIVTEEEKNILSKLSADKGIMPNQVTDIYKLRRGRFNRIRIWSIADLGTCRKKDLFITDANFKTIEGFVPMITNFGIEEDTSLCELLLELNKNMEKYQTTEPIIVTESYTSSDEETQNNMWIF